VEAKKYQEKAVKQRLRRVDIPPSRGTIYDRNGQELAISIEVFSVYATPYLISDPRDAAVKLSKVLKLDEKKIFRKLIKNTGFVYLARKVDGKVATQVKALKIEGIGLLKESKRVYPTSVASNIIGFVDIDNKGLAGLELFYDHILRGKSGRIVTESDPRGRSIPGGILSYVKPQHGGDIYLTLDREIQYKAEMELKRVIRQCKAKAGSVIVMDPENGEIYAMATTPTFDNNNLETLTSENRRNRAIINLYEPGSTMKVIIATAALEEKIFSPGSRFYLPPTIKVGNKVIREAHGRPARTFTFSEIVEKSSNIGAVTIGLKLGKVRIAKYIAKFGLLNKTGVDFPGEVAGRLPDVSSWSATTIGNVPFGQGIATTPLAMTKAVAMIANGGHNILPHFLLKRGQLTVDGRQHRFRQIISAKTSRLMREILTRAVEKGTGKRAQIDGYKVAGKTGTAQKPGEGGRGYEPGKYISSFIGFVPAEKPQLVISVVIEEPKGAFYGGTIAAPVFQKIAEFALRHLRIPPSSGKEIVAVFSKS
jgi:stage V sporulation protein D (sporulation-specific penicillin-binding protein)